MTSIEFLEAGQLTRPRRATWRHSGWAPVRRVVAQHPARIVGYIASWKTGQPTPWESQLERDFAVLLDTDPEVSKFYAQPVQIRYDFGDGLCHRYTPDFEVLLRDGGRYFAEIKPTHPRTHEPDFGRLIALFNIKGEQLRVIRAPEIHRQPRLSNALWCHSYAREPVAEEFRDRVVDILQQQEACALGDLLSRLGVPYHEGFRRIMRMLCRGELHFNKDLPIADESLIRLPSSSGGSST